MERRQQSRRTHRVAALVVAGGVAWAMVSCGGGGSTGNAQDSGPNKTYLSVEANDADGDALHYQWRVTAGSIENRDSPQTVWTMPDGPGLHFAYVVVSDGKGGYVEQQYAVATDALNTTPPPRAAITRAAPAITSTASSAGRLRFASADTLNFADANGARVERKVYLPDVQVQIEQGGSVVFSGITDLSGELSLPDLPAGTYTMKCATTAGAPVGDCAPGGAYTFAVAPTDPLSVRSALPPLTAARNLRLFGHVALNKGAACGEQNEFFGLQSAATVQLLQADGTALAAPTRVNRFGDYAIDAAVLAHGQYQLKVSCEGYSTTLTVPASPDPLGYVSSSPIELSHQIANAPPTLVKMVANGPDGNVRGQMIVPETGTSTSLPGWRQFLVYKGHDTRLSACRYYQAIGAAGGCDTQGNLQDPISLDDWKRAHKLKPYTNGNTEVAAVYINRMDLNLVRRMYATQAAADDIAFYVCNHPGPDGATQEEVDSRIDTGLSDQKQVACVAMEWSTSPGVNGGRPFTKFLTFGPDGALLPSINLDGRGEKYMPGACVACHAGTQYNGRFASSSMPSPYLGAGFLPFDTGNYLFGSGSGLSEAEQSQAIHDLNMLVKATDQYASNQSISKLIDGWYANGTTTTLNKQYVPDAWQQAEATQPGASKLYREVVGGVCRTCHAAMGSDNARFDWDSRVTSVINNPTTHDHFCGGSMDVAINASMPNALISRDRLADRIQADPALAALMQQYLGCVTPLPDPAYAKR
ncbi:MAG TPA: hypothetical protein VIO33_06090 [Burkholderiaceae bacterium]